MVRPTLLVVVRPRVGHVEQYGLFGTCPQLHARSVMSTSFEGLDQGSSRTVKYAPRNLASRMSSKTSSDHRDIRNGAARSSVSFAKRNPARVCGNTGGISGTLTYGFGGR